MNIKVIFTGGTIGSQVKQNGYISPKEKAPYELIENYKKQGKENIIFETEEPYNILSENLSSKELSLLIECVKKAILLEKYDGIIVTHGTDTLQYSAAILSYVLGGIKIPVVLVSSDFPLEDKRANGNVNFCAAMEFIKGKYEKGVFVSYCNKGGVPTIHRGTKLLGPKAFSGDVESIKGEIVGEFLQDKFVKGEEVYEDAPLFLVEEKVKMCEHGGEILRIVPFVGMSYPSLSEKAKVVILETYHSGTIGISKELKKFCQEAKEKNIQIYLTGLTRKEAGYETVGEYEKLGITPIYDQAPISQYCKIWLSMCNMHRTEGSFAKISQSKHKY